MAREFSKINTSVWNSKKFNDLSTQHKLFYLYALSSPHSNSCGCYVVHMGYIMADLDWKIEEIEGAINALIAVDLIGYNFKEHTLYLGRWFDFNPPTNPKHALKVFSDSLSIPCPILRDRCIIGLWRFLKGKEWEVNPKIKAYVDRVSRLGATETETETKTVRKKDTKKEKTISKLVPKITLEELSIDHILAWLTQKRIAGKYLTIDEDELLEMFKNYCRSKNKTYKDYVAAFKNSFRWDNAPTKGARNARQGKPSAYDLALEAAADFD